MTDHDEHPLDDSPAAQLRFRLGPRHTQRGIPIIDDHTGHLVATVGPGVEHADLVANLFVNAPQMFYAIVRVRSQLRAIVQNEARLDDNGTLAVRQLLREIHDTIDRHITTNATPKRE